MPECSRTARVQGLPRRPKEADLGQRFVIGTGRYLLIATPAPATGT